MTKKLLLIIFPALLALVAFPVNSCLAQQPSKNQPLTTTEVEAYKLQAHQLVKFMEYAFNSLGSSHATAREKDIIIQQSFLKFFKNSKVQIEDDLIEGRFVVTNKDVQAYLKDIDFFFKQVAFEFQIEDIAYHVNNRSQVFFIVKTYRTLEGITVENEPIKNNQLRYIEINLDPEHRDLKIASIYTTRLSEKEDMRQWWKHLDTEWRQFLAQGTPFGDQYMMRDVLSFDDKWMVIERRQMVTINEYQLESHRPDTIFINAGGMYSEIRRLWRIEELDLSKHTFFEDISPLSKLTQLRHLNLSKTSVDDLTPIRNLTRLETLDFSETKVLSIESLRFAINLKNLYFNKTGVHDLETLTGITALERLHANNTQISDISPVHSLENLRDLRLANTWVSNLSPLLQLKTLQILDVSSTRIKSLNDLRNLVQLERLHADNTSVTDLSPIKDLPKLQFISIEATELSDIMVLKSLPDLKRIYCDRTLIGHEKASQFAREKPGVLVVYESQALSDWWQTLPEAWNSIFKSQVEISPLPTREELHDLANLISIDISNNQEITSIEALHKLSKLKTIKAANTSIQSIASLKENFDLQWLDISGTGIDDLSPLASLKNLEYLNLSTTNIKSILPLVNNKQLRHVVMENTMVESINPLTKLNNLELVYADRINMSRSDVKSIYDTNPSLLMIYRTATLNDWWNGLVPEWKNVFSQHMDLLDSPSREQLHKLADTRELDISHKNGLVNLEPLIVFHRLQILMMNATQISDISTLQYLETLKELHCSSTPVKNLSAIRNLPSITLLDCSNTRLSSLEEIGRLFTLEYLNISGTQVRLLNPLKNLSSLRNLDCYNTRIMSLKPLKNLHGLRTLKCYNTRVSATSVEKLRRDNPQLEVVYY